MALLGTNPAMMGLLTNPMLNLGVGLLGAGGLSRQPQSLAGGLNLGLQNLQRAALLGQQMGAGQLAQEEAQRKAAEAAQREQFIGTQPPEVQGLMRMAPGAIAQEMYKARTAEPDKKYIPGSGSKINLANAQIDLRLKEFRGQPGVTERDVDSYRDSLVNAYSQTLLAQGQFYRDDVTGELREIPGITLPQVQPPSPAGLLAGDIPPGGAVTAPVAPPAPFAGQPLPPGPVPRETPPAASQGLLAPPTAMEQPMPAAPPVQPPGLGETLTPEQIKSVEDTVGIRLPAGIYVQGQYGPTLLTPGEKLTDTAKQKLGQAEMIQSSVGEVRRLMRDIDPSDIDLAVSANVAGSLWKRWLSDVAAPDVLFGQGAQAVGRSLTEKEAQMVSALELLAKNMIALMRGAQVGPREEETFSNALPKLGQDPALFNANLEATERNMRILQNRISGQPTTEGDGGLSAAEKMELEQLREMERRNRSFGR